MRTIKIIILNNSRSAAGSEINVIILCKVKFKKTGKKT